MDRLTRRGGVFGSSGAPSSTEEHPQARRPQSGKASTPGRPKTLKACKVKLLKLLGERDYTTHVMREKLMKAGFSAEMADDAIGMAVDAHLMDDARYARLYISAKADQGWGRRKIELGLGKQGIDCTLMAGYPEMLFPEEAEVERAVKCARGHRTSAQDVYASHYRYLASRGYAPAVCLRALRELRSE